MASSVDEIVPKLLKYFKDQNRPFSINDVLVSFHKEFGKAGVQKALDILVKNEEIIEKVNGKQKAYVIHQSCFPNYNPSEISALDKELSEKINGLKDITSQLKNKENILKKYESSLTTEEVIRKISTLETEVSVLEEEYEEISKNTKVISKEERNKVEKELEIAVKEWRKRKRMVLDITDAIFENSTKTKKVLFEEIGIETDENAGVKIPDI